MQLKETFLATLADTCFPKKLGQEDSRERLFFLARFHPDNKQKHHTEIAEEITAQIAKEITAQIAKEITPQNWGKSITTTASKVVHQLVQSYDEEMKVDQVNTEKLLNRKWGEKDAWHDVYYWLWEKKYLRWMWQILKEKAVNNSEWMSWTEVNHSVKGMKIPQFLQSQAKVLANTPLLMQLDLKYPNHYLLLLNRGKDTHYIVCPSQIWAPNGQLSGEVIRMPQTGAMCQEIEFDCAGQEEYLAIVVETAFNFPWLQTNEPVAEWNRELIEDLWNVLEEQGQVFYQQVEVVEGIDTL